MGIWTGIVVFCLIFASYANADCDTDVDDYINGLSGVDPSKLQLWSLEMFDSSTKFMTDGYMELAFLYQLANFDQCVAINGPAGPNGGPPRFTGQYCQFAVGLQLPPNASFTRNIQFQQNVQRMTNFRTGRTMTEPLVLPTLWGVCVPSSCGLEGAKRVADFNTRFFAASYGLIANTTMWEDTCYHENDGTYVIDAASWCFIAFVAILICLICVSTLLELRHPTHQYSGWKSIFNAFSLKQTLFKDLLRLPKAHVPGQLGCLHGMRTLSMMWIVLCHTYSIAGGLPVQNYVSYGEEFSHQWFMAPILNGYMAVDTFFLLSGLLTVYIPMMDLAKGRKFNVFKYYLYRYLRISIPLAVAIWFTSTVSIYSGKGPLWFVSFRYALGICQENWWANLLYISNYFFEYCMGHTWYLCVDMQLALLAPLIIYPLMKWPKVGLGAICILTLGSIAAIFAVTYTENLPWTMVFLGVETDVIDRYWDIMYENTPMRASPYLIGMALGYFLSKKTRVPLPRWSVALGWLVSTALALAVIFLILIPYSEGFVQNALEAAFYSSLHKPAWAISLSWIIWACVNGYGGIVDKILSWKYFVPASKLTFCCYLTHLLAMNVYAGLRRTPYFVSHFENLYLLGSFIILTFPYTIILYLVVEAPSMNLMRLAFKKQKSADPATSRIEKILGKKA
ncbi:nose resistant to fluoxetine protein 6-like [Cloeon dipterum]|uniref:nose resistant to fluoxetine protein 6-like n=1 Tax=Cloeon dipterum TaxID=197152 RepID=UPI00321F7138